MVRYKVGCLIEAAQSGEVNTIAHCANCFNTMKSGIAPQIAKAFPIAKIVDDRTCKGDWNKFGRYSMGTHSFDGSDQVPLTIFNLYGQYNYWPRDERHLHYDALKFAMRGMANELYWGATVGLPKLGAGLAGGDWNKIEKLINQEFQGEQVTIYVTDESEIPANREVINREVV